MLVSLEVTFRPALGLDSLPLPPTNRCPEVGSNGPKLPSTHLQAFVQVSPSIQNILFSTAAHSHFTFGPSLDGASPRKLALIAPPPQPQARARALSGSPQRLSFPYWGTDYSVLWLPSRVMLTVDV